MNFEKPFSVEKFLEKLAANDPELELDPTIQAGLQKLAQTVGYSAVVQPLLLLVDDSDHDVSLLRKALTETGVDMEVVRARNGREALDYFEGKGPFGDRGRFPLPHLTILDMKMPGIDGIEVLRQMRQLSHCQQLMVIALTGVGDEIEMLRAQAHCISAYLVKPRTLSELIELVRQVKTSWIDRISPGRASMES